MKKMTYLFALIVMCIAGFTFTGCSQVDQTERGVVLSWGSVSGVAEPGLKILNPFSEEIVKLSVKTEIETVTLEAGTKDQQMVGSTINVNYHLNPAKVAEIYSQYGVGYVNSIIRPKIAEAITGTVPQYTAEELLRSRELVRTMMDSTLKAKLDGSNIIVDNVAIVSFKFSDAYTAAIEEKQIAEQRAKTEKNKEDQERHKGEQMKIAAEAKRDAIKAELEALKLSNSKEYIMLKAIEKWDGKLPVSTGVNTLPFLDLK